RHANDYLIVESNDLVVEDSSEGGEKAGTKKLIYHHLTLLAENEAGWKNLMRIHAESHNTFWSKPRIDTKLIEENSEGIIILTGCLGGMIAGPLSRGDENEARKNLERFIEVVGEDNVYVEIMDHGLEIERRTTIPKLVELADEYDLPLVATNDCHYVHQDKSEAHDAWLALQSSHGKKAVRLSDPDRFRFRSEVVGEDNVYVEIMDHGLEIERRTTIPKLVELADEYDLPLVATNDCHYVHQDKSEAHDAWLALQSSHGKKAVRLSDPDRFRF